MKTKDFIISTFAILYGLLSFLLSSETFVTHIIEAKKTYYITKSQSFKSFIFTNQQWNKIADKNEVKIGHHYYDVKKVSISDDMITVKAIQDNYENTLKSLSKNIFKKYKKNKITKSKRAFEVTINKNNDSYLCTNVQKIEHNYFYNSLILNLSITPIFHPPCGNPL